MLEVMKIDLDPSKKVYFLTVPHTGTHSVRMMLDQMGIEYRFTHFEKVYEIKIDGVLEDHNVITTYRDPFLVAASWANRVKFNAKRIRRFQGNWTRWGIILPHAAKVVTTEEMTEWRNKLFRGDPSGAALALSEGNWSRYFDIVPRQAVEHAYEITSKAGYTSPYEVAL